MGARTTLSLRPERVIIACQEGEVENRLVGRVEELIYLGDHIRARLSVAGTEEFVVKIPNTDRNAAPARGHGREPGLGRRGLPGVGRAGRGGRFRLEQIKTRRCSRREA